MWHCIYRNHFEWLILSAGILKNNHVTEILDAPYDYVDSEESFFSWERFFTSVLMMKRKIPILRI